MVPRLQIPVLPAIGGQEDQGDGEGQKLCHGDGVPDAVQAQNQGQEQDGKHLEYQGPQEGDGR